MNLMDTTTTEGWPERPRHWPDVLTDLEVCQLLGLDAGRSPEQARRTLRHIRRTQGGPADLGRIGGAVRFRKATVDAWLVSREQLRSRRDSENKQAGSKGRKSYCVSGYKRFV